MSTRCQVQVIEDYANGDQEKATLYHHCDGYPSNMLRLFWESWQAMHNYTYKMYKKMGYKNEDCKRYQEYSGYQLDRCGYVSSFLCFVDPTGYGPLGYHDLHGDIEYYYRLYTAPAVQDKSIWEVEVYTSHGNKSYYEDKCTKMESMTLLIPRTPLDVFITKRTGKVNKNFLKKLKKMEELINFQQNR